MKTNSLLFKWRDAIASELGPPAMTRLILLCLALHMDKNGNNCFPSTEKIAARAGVSERTVCTHLEQAEKAGWIKRGFHLKKTRGWRRHQYYPVIPPMVLKIIQHHERKNSHGTEPDDTMVLKEVQSNTSVNSSNIDSRFFSEVVSYLNLKTGKHFKPTSKATLRLIHARASEAFTLEDFKHVIDVKTEQWLSDEQMSKFLRPQTLFGTKFEGYLQEQSKHKPETRQEYRPVSKEDLS